MDNKYTFKILPEEVANADEFEGKPYEKIAKEILSIIKSSDYGHTIGLQGQWGVGKSTIIHILGKEIEKNDQSKIKYFYFDAWEHEGDPLRRIFLEALIEQCKGERNTTLEDLQSVISKKTIKKKIKTKRYASELGTILGISAFFSPLGIGLLSASNAEHITLGWGAAFDWVFTLGVILGGAPIWVVLLRAISIWCKKGFKAIFKRINWPLIQNDSSEDITDETSIEEDKTTIEFADYFNKILAGILGDEEKLIIVIDNLDRINVEDALTIWSTLQTYLQHRNPKKERSNKLYRRIWTLVPYDEAALNRIWDRPLKGENSSGKSNHRSKSFFEKSFQLRMDIPKPILTGWESLLSTFMEKSIGGWPEEDKVQIKRIFKYTREDLAHNPTPRELKAYINQIGLLKSHTGESIPVQHIAYYVINRYLDRIGIEKITEDIIAGTFPSEKDQTILGGQSRKLFAGLIFGVSPKIGMQLLLGPTIKKELAVHEGSKIDSLVETHGSLFWSVFDYEIGKDDEFPTLFSYAYIMEQKLSNHTQRISDYRRNLARSLKVNIKKIPIDPTGARNCVGALLLLDANDRRKNWEKVIKHCMLPSGRSDADDDYFRVRKDFLLTLVEHCGDGEGTTIVEPNLAYANWIEFLKTVEGGELKKISKATKPSGNLGKDVIKRIRSIDSEPTVLKLINLSCDTSVDMNRIGIEEALVEYLQAKYPQNQGQSAPRTDTDISRETFATLAKVKIQIVVQQQSTSHKLSENSIYRAAQQHKSDNPVLGYLILISQCDYGNTIVNADINKPARPGARQYQIRLQNQGLVILNKILKSDNPEIAQHLWDIIKEERGFTLLVDMSSSEENGFLKQILAIALKGEDTNLLIGHVDSFETYSKLLRFIGGDSREPFTEQVIQNPGFEQSFISLDGLDITKHTEAIYRLTMSAETGKIHDKLKKELKKVPKSELEKAFEKYETTPLEILERIHN